MMSPSSGCSPDRLSVACEQIGVRTCRSARGGRSAGRRRREPGDHRTASFKDHSEPSPKGAASRAAGSGWEAAAHLPTSRLAMLSVFRVAEPLSVTASRDSGLGGRFWVWGVYNGLSLATAQTLSILEFVAVLKTAPPLLQPLSGALPMATPHHHTFPTEEQRRRHPQRSLLRRTQLQRPPAPDSFTQTCMPQPAPCCVAGTKRELATQPLWSWWRANPGSAIARHAHGALLRNGCVLTRAHPQPARPPARRTLRRTHHPETRAPTGVAASCRCARTHLQPRAHGGVRGGAHVQASGMLIPFYAADAPSAACAPRRSKTT